MAGRDDDGPAPGPPQPPMLGTDATPWMSAEDIQAALHPAVMDDGRGGGGGPVFCISARPDLGGRRAFRLVATASENRLSFRRRNPHTSFAAASDCPAIAIL
jgi:hypothetical protein